jgi:N-acetylneuraminic acid mutarotase
MMRKNLREEIMPKLALVSAAALVALVLAMPGLSQSGGAAGRWRAKAPLPTAMAEVGVAALGGRIYVLGGTAQGRFDSPLNEEYDPASDHWRARAPMPKGLSHVGAAALGGKLYAIGGFINIIHVGAQDAAFVYDPASDAWRALPPLSSPRASVAAAAVGGKLHVIGGRGLDKATVAIHEVYDPATNAWITAAPLPVARDHAGIAVLDGKIHVFGGRTADVTDNVALHDVYDPASDTWRAAAPLPVPRSSGAATVYRGLILFAGGECKPGGKPGDARTFDDVDAYDAKSDKWVTLAALPQGRHAFGAATVGDTAYFAGGTTTCGGGNTTDMLAFTLP